MNTKTKKQFLKEAKQHRKADRFIQGEWINGKVQGKYSGCFFGCMTQTKDNALGEASEIMDLPLWLVSVAEKIFEGLPQEQAVEFPVQFITACTPDKNYDQAYKDWHYNLLMDKNHGQIVYAGDNKQVKDAIIQCANLFKMDEIDESAAWSAWSAWSAAWSAAESAAWSAWSARSAAMSAVESAWSAARQGHYQWMRDELIKTL